MVKIIDIKTRRVSVKHQGSPAQLTPERDYETGRIVARLRVSRSTVELLQQRGKLTGPQSQAADTFRSTFENSFMQPRFAKVSFDRVQYGYREFTKHEVEAGEKIEKALEAIRPEGRGLGWYVVGFSESLSDYRRRRHNMNRPLAYTSAKRLLLSVLDDLASHYGY